MPAPFTLTPWSQLVKEGIPDFIVARHPFTTDGVTTEVGEPVPPALKANRIRLRQFYERRLITAVGVESPRDRIVRRAQQIRAMQTDTFVTQAVDILNEGPITSEPVVHTYGGSVGGDASVEVTESTAEASVEVLDFDAPTIDVDVQDKPEVKAAAVPVPTFNKYQQRQQHQQRRGR